MTVHPHDLREALRPLDLAGRLVCVHASLRSFGRVEGGADAVVEAFLEEGCTLLVPTFSWQAYRVNPPPGERPARNGMGENAPTGPAPGDHRRFTPLSREIDGEMGAIPAAVLRRSRAVRGNHPLMSFSAVGPRAVWLVEGQLPGGGRALDPLQRLADHDGRVVLMSVGLERLTLLHLAEQRAGRRPFLRWANDARGERQAVEVGGCSEGFGHLDSLLAPLRLTVQVRSSRWQVYGARPVLEAATGAIVRRPSLTHCGDPECERCRDAVLGGPDPERQ